MKQLQALRDRIAALELSAETREELDKLFKKVERDVARQEFSIQRLTLDKSITENFLNVMISDLEKANKEILAYKQLELKEKENTIRYQESQLKQITDAMPSSLAFVDLDFKYQINNKSYADWFGYEVADLKGKHIKTIIGEEGYKRVLPFFEKAIKGERQRFETILTDKNGKELILQVVYLPAFDHKNRIVGCYVYGQDITSLKKNERAIESKNQELQKYIESNLQLENFAYLASHDLRSPLSNVINFVGLLTLSAYDKLNEEEKQFLEYINSGSMRMQQFIEDLLAFSLATNHKAQYKCLNIRELLDDVLTDIKSQIKKAKAKITIGTLPEKIYGDKVLLKQLLLNLLTNAIKFVKPGTIPEVCINCNDRGKEFLFSVKDNGIGIEKSDQSKIFAIFRRLHLRSEYEGTGIGLSTCKNAVEKHGGKIWIDSEAGKGSTFFFTLPKLCRQNGKTKQNETI